ncbi:MAG: CHRD domain-containing protein [Phycisphaerales bacterium]
MTKTAQILATVGFAAMAAASANATIYVYTANMDGISEAPPNASPGIGFTTITMDDVLNTMRVEATFSGLLGTTTAAHIHAATAVAGTGTAGVATQTPSFSGFPLGVSSGSMDTTFDMTLASSYNASFITANGGTPLSAFAALRNALNNGKAYFNIHSSVFGGGEIRGFPVPTPGVMALVGLAGLVATRRRR